MRPHPSPNAAPRTVHHSHAFTFCKPKCAPPRFSLQSWEQLSRLLIAFFPGVPLYGTHILKMHFGALFLPDSARTLFCLRSGPSGQVVGLSFGWKYSLYICQRALAQVVGSILPPDILLDHYLDMVMVHHDHVYPPPPPGAQELPTVNHIDK